MQVTREVSRPVRAWEKGEMKVPLELLSNNLKNVSRESEKSPGNRTVFRHCRSAGQLSHQVTLCHDMGIVMKGGERDSRASPWLLTVVFFLRGFWGVVLGKA